MRSMSKSRMVAQTSDTEPVLGLRAGEMVEVRSKSEILATLDPNGRRDALPFMPEMLQHCGQRFSVYRRADKTCDTIQRPRSLRMENAVHLENARCDGAAHGGCQAGCLIFWKESWLKRVEIPGTVHSIVNTGESFAIAATPVWPSTTSVCTEEALSRASRRQPDATSVEEEAFSCQATELPNATSPLTWWDVRQYARDITSGNVCPSVFARGMVTSLFNIVIRSVRRIVFAVAHRVSRRVVSSAEPAHCRSTARVGAQGHASPMDRVVAYVKATLDTLLVEYPHVRGALPKTPSTVLNLQPGELVHVKTKEEIVDTLDVNNRNRGLLFDVEMVPYCDGTYRVLRRVERILDEKTGKMLTLPNNCIILDGVVCRGCLSRHRLFCPRSIYSYWHEIWLRRVE